MNQGLRLRLLAIAFVAIAVVVVATNVNVGSPGSGRSDLVGPSGTSILLGQVATPVGSATPSVGSAIPSAAPTPSGLQGAVDAAIASASPMPKPTTVAPTATPKPLVPPDGKMHRVEIGGRKLAIWCEGTGSPTVLLEHGIGYGIDSDSWKDVQEGVARETRVCRYDRAWVGDSDDAKVGRSMPDLAQDLMKLMTAARIPGPYIIVGHSFGGLVVRNFAKTYPKSVVGVVLVDGSPRSAIVGLDLSSERLSASRVLAQLTALEAPGILGHTPLVVITRGIGLSASWAAAQKAEAKLSSSSRQVIATHSGHFIQLSEPDLVIRQILTVLHTIRRYS